MLLTVNFGRLIRILNRFSKSRRRSIFNVKRRRVIVSLFFLLFTLSALYHLIVHLLAAASYRFSFNLNRRLIENKFSASPLCVNGILSRERRVGEKDPILLTDGEDPYQTNGNCRLHHYEMNQVVACVDQLSYRRARHQQPVHIAFIGESILRHQFVNFLRVSPNLLT